MQRRQVNDDPKGNKMKKTTSLATTGLIATTALLLAGCGSPSAPADDAPSDGASVYEELNSLPADEARERAIELATEEAYAAAFTDDTGVPVEVFRASSVDLNQRALQELDAGRLGADLLIGSFPALISIGEEGAFQAFEGDALDELGEDAQYEGGWMEIAGYAVLPIWNTDLIAEGGQPASWEDLADSRFDGKLSVAAEDGDLFGAISTIWADQGKSQEEIDGLWADILDGASATTGHSAQMQALGAGQWGISAWNYSFIADLAIGTGAPVSYLDENGESTVEAMPYPLGLGMFKDAAHPAAAWLFNDWMLNEGQAIMQDNHFLTAKQIVGVDPVDGLTLVPFPYEVEEDVEQWNNRWDSLLRGVPVVEEQ
jgi:iron(III) transport system substrate-binding protein